MTIFYTRDQIAGWLGRPTYLKALDYEHDVSSVRWYSETELMGIVQGSRRDPYTVLIKFSGDSNSIQIRAGCTCPVGYQCKHAAAVLIAALQSSASRTNPTVRSEVITWLENFRADVGKIQNEGGPSAKSRSPFAIAYILSKNYRGNAEIYLYKGRQDAQGRLQSLDDPWENVDRALLKPPKFVTRDDLEILRGLSLGNSTNYGSRFELTGSTGSAILEKIVATGRTMARSSTEYGRPGQPYPVQIGPARPGDFIWNTLPDGRLRPELQTDPPATLLLTAIQPNWYVDFSAQQAGVVETPYSADLIAAYLSMPALSKAETVLVGNVISELVPHMPLPPGVESTATYEIDVIPQPVLKLDSMQLFAMDYRLGRHRTLDFVTVHFDYNGVQVAARSKTTLMKDRDGAVVQIRRADIIEKRRLSELTKVGFTKVPTKQAYGPREFPPGMLMLDSEDDWVGFMSTTLPDLRENGWQVEMTDTFRFNVVDVDTIDGAVREGGDGWFDVEMGITVNARTVQLVPLLAELFQRDTRWLSGQLERISDDEKIELKTNKNERVRLRADRIKPLVRILIDLFEVAGKGPLRLSKWDAVRLESLDQTGRWEFHGDTSVRQLAQRLKSGSGIAEVPVPAGLLAELRPYQREGLSWRAGRDSRKIPQKSL